MRSATMTAMAALVLLAGCGGSDEPDEAVASIPATVAESAPSSATTAPPVAPASTVAPATTMADGPDSEWCVVAAENREWQESIDDDTMADPEAMEAYFTEAHSRLSEARAVVPDELADHLDVAVASMEELLADLEAADWSIYDVDMSILETDEAKAAEQAIDDYNEDVCGLPSNEDEDDDGGSSLDPTSGSIREQFETKLIEGGASLTEAKCVAGEFLALDNGFDDLGDSEATELMSGIAETCDVRLADLLNWFAGFSEAPDGPATSRAPDGSVPDDDEMPSTDEMESAMVTAGATPEQATCLTDEFFGAIVDNPDIGDGTAAEGIAVFLDVGEACGTSTTNTFLWLGAALDDSNDDMAAFAAVPETLIANGASPEQADCVIEELLGNFVASGDDPGLSAFENVAATCEVELAAILRGFASAASVEGEPDPLAESEQQLVDNGATQEQAQCIVDAMIMVGLDDVGLKDRIQEECGLKPARIDELLGGMPEM